MSLTYGKIHKIICEVLCSEGWSLTSYNLIAKRVLERFFPEINVYTETFETIRNSFISEFKYEDKTVPLAENDFFEFFCKEFCHIPVLPLDNFISNYKDTVSKIAQLDDNIKFCEEEKKKLFREKQEKGFWGEGQNYKNLQYDYYIQKNKDERESLINFLVYKLPEKSACDDRDVLTKAFDELFKPLDIRMKLLDVNNYNEINNKFLDLPYPEYLNLQKLYKDKFEDFKNYVSSYIRSNNVIDKIQDEININHFLIRKSETVKRIIDAYLNCDYFIFNNLVPLYIEGVFADICLELEISQKELNASSLNDKLDIIRKKISFPIIYEYFAFTFPIVRNKIAHGDLQNQEDEYYANMLLLDLYSVVHFANDDKLPFNDYRKKIDKLFNDKSESLYREYIWNPNLLNGEIDSFYADTCNHLSELRVRVEGNEFVEYILKLDYDYFFTADQILKVLCILKKKEIEKDRVSKRIKEINLEITKK